MIFTRYRDQPFPNAGIGTGLFALVACFLFLGCARDSYDGPPRHPVSGTVFYEGKPIPKGFIAFDPDTSRGASGPGTTAEIIDGHYATPDGRGVVDGANIARIIGFDGISIPASEDGTPLFSEVRIPVDLPAEKTTYDLELPLAEP